MKKTVVLGVSSGIAAYKTLELVKLLKKEGINVFVIMTKHACRMVSPQEFEKASGNKIYSQLFEKNFDYKNILKVRKVDHIALADSADLVIIVPATANIIAKLAHGIADDFLTTTVLATTAPILLCPSMNVHMWNNPIVQENVAQLRTHGFHIIEPTSGMLACGYEGEGRLADVQNIYREIKTLLSYTSSLQGKRILVTAGGTIEKIDNVRFISNRSSGKMGIAIAEECFLRGADVLLLRAKNSVKPRYLIQEKIFTTSDDLFSLVKENIKSVDIFFHVAAVSDFRVQNFYKGKLPSEKRAAITLEPREKIINRIRELNPHIKLIAFKAEYGLTESELVKKTQEKLLAWNADAVVANDISRNDSGFESNMNEVYVVLKNGEVKKIGHDLKRNVAREIVEYMSNFL